MYVSRNSFNWYASAAVGLLVVGMTLTAAAIDPMSTEDPISGITDSSRISGDPLITGSILDAKGAPVGEGELVVLRAWPDHSTMARLAVGESVKMTTVATALTQADGTFALRISDKASASSIAMSNGNGLVDFQIVSAGVNHLSVHSFTAQPDGELDSAPKSVQVASIPGAEFPNRGAQDMVDKACSTWKKTDVGPRWVKVGYGYTSATGGTVTFTYTSGSSSTLGTAVSATGASGSFSVSGTSSWSSTATISYPATSGNKIWKTQFRYGVYTTVCDPGLTWHDLRADGFVGGSSIVATSAPAATYCTSFIAGSSFTKETTSAYTHAAAVEIAAFAGINLKATTGFSTKAKLKYTFPNGGKLCGTNGYPGGTPLRLVAKN